MSATLRVLLLATLLSNLCCVPPAYGEEPIEFWLQTEDAAIPATTSLGTRYWNTQISFRMLVPASIPQTTLIPRYLMNFYGNVSFSFRDAKGKPIGTSYTSNTLLAPNAGEIIGLSPGIVEQVSFTMCLRGHELSIMDNKGGWFYCDLARPGKVVIEADYRYHEDDQDERLQDVEKQSYGPWYPYRKTINGIFKGLGKSTTAIMIKSLQ